MGSEVDANASAVDSDGSVSWEDFFGTTTDLVPQLLGMFDELARRGNGCTDHRVFLPSNCGIPAALQKRLSLVQHSHRSSILGQLCNGGEVTKNPPEEETHATMTDQIEIEIHEEGTNDKLEDTVAQDIVDREEDASCVTVKVEEEQEESTNDEKPTYRRESSGLTPLRYNGRCRTGRPLSGSSIASSTSSSGCSNQGNACTANPYLASVESLADTCASSQGSGDSGVVTISEASCRIGNGTNSQRRIDIEDDSPCYRPRYCDPHRNPVERVLLEIVDTEAIYVEHLRQVIQGYLIFWRDDPTFAHRLQLNDLFSNIEDIFEFNREFLKEIEKCGLDPVCVANTFIKHNSGFKVYTEYCTNYPKTVSVLTDLMGQEETASAFRERQAALRHALPLGSFLLKPVQRILKYHLLLENLSKEYGEYADCNARENEAEGRSAIEAALAAMTGIAKHINAMKRRHEHAVRVQEIQSLLYGWPGPDLTTSGELIAEGRFRLRGARAPRHAFLFDRMLLLTKKKEDGLLVYKAHITCSNLMLIESIPGEPLSFHVIPFDNPRLQYKLQARNLEQKREWTLQIKRVILENYNAVIPSHARQLVLQLGQTQPDDDSLVDKGLAKKQYSAPPEYLERRKQERERRRSETGLRQKFKKNCRKSDGATTENSPASPRKNHSEDSAIDDSREHNLNRSSDGRASKVKERFTGWRRKSEPGFQSYVSLNQSDEEQKDNTVESTAIDTETITNSVENEQPLPNSTPSETKESNNEQQQAQTVEEIVGHILMQNQEFQKLLEKQRTNSILNVRQQQRFNKRISADTSDGSDSENTNYATELSADNRTSRLRASNREQRLIRTNNAWNALSSPPSRENQSSLRLLYDNLNVQKPENEKATKNNKINCVKEKRALFEAFKRQSIVTESKIIKTALRIRENSTANEENLKISLQNSEEDHLNSMDNEEEKELNEERKIEKSVDEDESKGFGNYDNLRHVWEGLHEEKDIDNNDSPTRPAVWLTKLCEDMPTSPQKCGSLPRSFQINPNSQPAVTKSRFLQRDGKPMSERPFTIASDKPAEINLEDMERYASTCQPEGRIAKFPTPASSSSSTFFCALDETITDAYSDIRISDTTTDIHPEHKIYRANGSGSVTLKNVLSKAGSRLQGLRNTVSTETLECNEEFERTKYFRSLSTGKLRKKSKAKHSRDASSDIEELTGCVSGGNVNDLRIPSLCYKQGSSSLGARIAQSDYADPTVLFSENKRASQITDIVDPKKLEKEEKAIQKEVCKTSVEKVERRESETDSFYEKCFETIENYVDVDVDDAFRDSAIFSDADEVPIMHLQSDSSTGSYSKDTAKLETYKTDFKSKTAPPVPAKKKSEIFSAVNVAMYNKCKPCVAHKPDHLKARSALERLQNVVDEKSPIKSSTIMDSSFRYPKERGQGKGSDDRDDVSAGQSQAGWVRKIVGQLQAQIET